MKPYRYQFDPVRGWVASRRPLAGSPETVTLGRPEASLAELIHRIARGGS